MKNLNKIKRNTGYLKLSPTKRDRDGNFIIEMSYKHKYFDKGIIKPKVNFIKEE